MDDFSEAPDALLAVADLARLREALTDYTVDGVHELLGPIGRAAHERGDLAGVSRAVRRSAGPDRLATLIRLFLLGDTVSSRDAGNALRDLPLGAADAGGIVEVDGDDVRAAVEIRPYAQDDLQSGPWWVVSDLGSDVRPGPLAPTHVLGIGNAALTLAQATPRDHAGRALDVGTGCGVQALHLATHCDDVAATDISARALRLAATTAGLSGQRWRLRQGSLLDPVAGERFDLVVANPPFVVSPGGASGLGGYDYRDSGLAGDAVCRELVRGLPRVLEPGGTAQLLANWIVPRDGSWQDRVAPWFEGGGCDAWIWQREVADLGEYVTMWLRDAGGSPGTAGWSQRYDAWLDWFDAHGVAAIGMGMITMQAYEPRDPDASGAPPGEVVFDDVPQAIAQPIGGEIGAWFRRLRHTSRMTPDELLTSRFRAAPGLVRARDDLLDDDAGWRTERATLRQPYGMRWEIEVDDAVASVVAACGAGATPLLALEVLAATSGDDLRRLAARFEPVLRDLVRRGVLLPELDR